MVQYLQVDGVDDRFQLPSTPVSEIVMDIKVYDVTSGGRYYFDLRSGINQIYYRTSTVDYYSGTATVYWDGVVKANNNRMIPSGARGTLRFVLGTAGTDDLTFFSRNDFFSTSFMQADVYDIKIYNGGVLQAHYDMSTGTVQDQSGNGRHATLTGGTFVDDGTGGGAVNATVNAVTANVAVSSIIPVVTAEKQVSVTSVIAVASTNALSPNVTTSSAVSAVISGVVASATAEAFIPQVGSNTNITIQAVNANATINANVPNVATAGNIAIGATIAQAVASAIVPNVVSGPLSVQITAVIASLQAEARSPLVAIKNTIIGVIALQGHSPSSIQLTSRKSNAIHINGSIPSTIHLKGGIQ